MTRIHLSIADVGEVEESFVLDALRSGWVAPLGPHVDAFEAEVAERVGVNYALALASGTAALHLALLNFGAGPGTSVVLPSMTFAASANAVMYTGATPVFVDSDLSDGNIDVSLLLRAIDTLRREGSTVAAVMVVDLFGRCANYAAIVRELRDREVPLLEDAAESLGSIQGTTSAGAFGQAAALSFNGNKIMTTSGGGMLLSNDKELIERARYLSAQARQPFSWYEHTEVGYNYRLSNILAALGRAQLTRLDSMIVRRRTIREHYVDATRRMPGLRILGHASDSDSQDNSWLTSIVLDRNLCPAKHDALMRDMHAADVEVRHVWKPLHMQPVFQGQRAFLSGHAEELFRTAITLPSGSSLSDNDVDRVVDVLERTLAAP